MSLRSITNQRWLMNWWPMSSPSPILGFAASPQPEREPEWGVTAKRVISGLVLKFWKGERWLIPAGQWTALPRSNTNTVCWGRLDTQVRSSRVSFSIQFPQFLQNHRNADTHSLSSAQLRGTHCSEKFDVIEPVNRIIGW
jgi:hypothetical protein